MSKFLDFGCIGIKKLSILLFGIGTMGIFAAACINGYSIFLANTYETMIKQGDWYTAVEVNNLPLSILCGVLYFTIGTLFWRLLCEIIYIVLEYFKSNTNREV